MKRPMTIAKESIFEVMELVMQQAGIDKHQIKLAYESFRQLIKRKHVRTRQ